MTDTARWFVVGNGEVKEMPIPNGNMPEGAVTCPLCTGDGWYLPAMEPTDEQIGKLLYDLDHSLSFEKKAIVREWLANL